MLGRPARFFSCSLCRNTASIGLNVLRLTPVSRLNCSGDHPAIFSYLMPYLSSYRLLSQEVQCISKCIFAILFAESGLLIGIMLPGDSLLFTAGLCAQGSLSLWGVVAVLDAVLGGSTGYWISKRFGPAVSQRPESRFFKPAYIKRARRILTATLLRALCRLSGRSPNARRSRWDAPPQVSSP